MFYTGFTVQVIFTILSQIVLKGLSKRYWRASQTLWHGQKSVFRLLRSDGYFINVKNTHVCYVKFDFKSLSLS